MNLLKNIKNSISELVEKEFETKVQIQINLNVDKSKEFGDLNCNAAMVLAKKLGRNPREIAAQIEKIITESDISQHIKSVEIAGPGFINIHFQAEAWSKIAQELAEQKNNFFTLDETDEKKSFLVEFVSANPTGPLHLGHGRNGIIGDVLGSVLKFLGHKADKEFYINDAGSQMLKLGTSLKIRCQQTLGQIVDFPEDGYAGDYMIDLAKECVEHYGNEVLEREDSFFEEYAREHLLEKLKETLASYGIHFDRWFSEKGLHQSGAVEDALEILQEKGLAYEKDDAIWFKATEFGDDKDRVLKKSDGAYTYIAADIAYHKDKFERGYDTVINILGQDHHGYVKRLKGTMAALGYDSDNLDVILYQLVKLKSKGEQIRMSKRAGKFEKLDDVIEKVGCDVARFFYLNRKADAHLDFDLDVALKKTEENPVYYIQYAYVRTKSLLDKAKEEGIKEELKTLGAAEIKVIKKICSLHWLLQTIASSYQTHVLAYYTLELAKTFHNYYANNRIINTQDIETSQSRLFVTKLIRQTLTLCLDLLGLTKPERM